MPTPDFNRSRRFLRRARISDALDLGSLRGVQGHRDRLLELVLSDSTLHEGFGALSDDKVDVVVSLALAEVAESLEDSILVALLCFRVLAADGQFARVRQLVGKLRYLSSRSELERPFLALALVSLAD